jgi:hypothetical protein
MRVAVFAFVLFLAACNNGEDGSSSTSSSGAPSEESTSGSSANASSGSSGSSAPGSSASSGASGSSGTSGSTTDDPKKAICEAYADLVIACCNPPYPQCAEDKHQGWVDFCMKGYDSCKKGYECLAKATCATKASCPNFGTGCQ